ncbi:group 1 truncated hemoglobin [Ruegeria pomeroyi]|nr:group 1 truncated hemoglobin [Ruegeria pomeroyi]MCE8524665.1 group 1 truncated hemoglobin [Ruegeria pomeroyi]MCE8528795.1 group 1 truncated hemoglobin [Ruegeria pomeroyi]MCE8544750.1 group 1 truncated hemoglobin [Ruegeria pomeroyi]
MRAGRVSTTKILGVLVQIGLHASVDDRPLFRNHPETRRRIIAATLFDRLGGADGIRRIVGVLVDNHAKNPVVAPRFAGSDMKNLKKMAGDFFIAGSGGPEIYTGKDMIAAHKHMNISGDEFVAVLDDAMNALQANNVGQREQEEVLFNLYSLKDQVVGI